MNTSGKRAQCIWPLQHESQRLTKDGEAQEASMANVAELTMQAVTIAMTQQPKLKTLKVT